MREDDKSDFKVDFATRKPDFEQLKTICDGLIKNSLDQAGIDYLSVEARVKSDDSAFEKSMSHKYDDPLTQITDFVALRVIVFLDRDVDGAADLLKSLFEIDPENSIDKRTPEKVDTVGYRSLHLVCRLGQERSHLDEYTRFAHFPFEIQIRTALQHAWAEIEHKRRYKGSATLPNTLQHRLMALSGTLELVDREFSAIAVAAEEYSLNLQDKSQTDKDRDILSEIAIAAVYNGLVASGELSQNFIQTSEVDHKSTLTTILMELMDFGVVTVGDLKRLTEKVTLANISEASKHASTKLNVSHFLRAAMMSVDLEMYLDEAHKGHFNSIDLDTFDFLVAALGRTDLETAFDTHRIMVVPF